MTDMLARLASIVGGATLPFLLHAALAVVLTPRLVEGWPAASRWRAGSALAGATAGLVFAVLRETAVLHQRTFVIIPTVIACVVVDAVLLLALLAVIPRPERGWAGRWSVVIQTVACAALALTFFRAVPDLVLQLTAFIEPGEQVLSTTMLLRVLGFLGGWAGTALLAHTYYRTARRAPERLTRATLVLFVAVFGAVHTAEAATVLQANHRLALSGSAFRATAWLHNHMQGTILLAAAAVWLVPFVTALLRVLGRSPRQDNPARTRAVRASRRVTRRWVLASLAGFAALAATRTVVLDLTNEKVELSEPEPYTLDGDAATIPLATLADGHLHRFAYDAGGTEVRWIVILKNGGAYGVGLDACESCGPSGYYEKDGSVICRECDVAINVATVGFKGGCNPIPLEFAVTEQGVTVPVTALTASAKVFA